MKTRKLAPGEEIYREGAASDCVYVVEEGEIEVRKTTHGQQVRLAILKRGDIFGEVGVIRGMPRSTTTVALGKVRLLVMPKEDFLGAFGSGNDLTFRVLNALCERLAGADEQIVSRWAPREAVKKGAYKEIQLLPDSEPVAKQIGSDGLFVRHLPFRVGALEGGSGMPFASDSELAMYTHEKFQLSHGHFVIDLRDDNLVVADLGSHLGTVVNGVRVSGFEHVSTAGLTYGENSVIAGGLDSPYRFVVQVE